MVDTRDTINRCISFIEKNITRKLNLDEIAAHSLISKYYLHRMFRALTGESLMDYVHARKLSESISDLMYSDLHILDIALKYGFEYEQSYIRAFRQNFKCTPQQVRRGKISLRIVEKININDIYGVENSAIYKPFFVFRPKTYLVGKKTKIMNKSGDRAANELGTKFFYGERKKIKNILNENIYYGYTDWSNSKNGYIYYMPATQVENLQDVPEDMSGIEIPAGKYVVFRFVGFFRPEDLNGRKIGRVLVHMYTKWIFNSGYRFSVPFRFELIDSNIATNNYCELDIYQPIESEHKN
ncbi:AraC family transcriptional regulator [Pectinatus cerevisiiphilus]|uniref:AraC family transcriptional regulator n=1 Tax=Pectinatus cerevisiiphilus TaxID=86956 RepID=A0A4R3K644_9FIRM|nr:helix-turn-helix domain-containing protein [Pectinatus cerevisiiphilus]TCS78217.1 AraC family transcriptional regulator [Pectinatus cerevisiiphilus]